MYILVLLLSKKEYSPINRSPEELNYIIQSWKREREKKKCCYYMLKKKKTKRL